jgi:NADH:ubiquinone reductase (H+-translocating)
MTRVLIVGGGFAGINAAKGLGDVNGIEVTVLDRRNHHLFQPLLYQVATAGLSPAEIAAPIRHMLSRYTNIRVVLATVESVDLRHKVVSADIGTFAFDYLILCCGATHSYFGHDQWEEYAPGLKTLEQATEIRRRVLTAFEEAERTGDSDEQHRLLTFAIVGGGPTGVELAGAIAEMSRFTLARDFRSISARSARVVLLEAGPRILAMFSEDQATRAAKDLEALGVEVRVRGAVTNIDRVGVQLGEERLRAGTVLWAAGVKASPLGAKSGVAVDREGRVIVEPDLTVKDHPSVFVIGDQARFTHQTGKPLPGTAPVAMQAGRYAARTILDDLRGRPRRSFHFVDKGQMATIGRSRAVLEIGSIKLGGFLAWLLWLVIHIYYLTGFDKRLLVITEWAWSYLTFARGARLITGRDWHMTE